LLIQTMFLSQTGTFWLFFIQRCSSGSNTAHRLLEMLWGLLKRHSKPCRRREECNKYDLTAAAAPCFWLAIIMIGPGGLLLVVPTYLQMRVFSYMGGFAK
jgi:hypothetical protein